MWLFQQVQVKIIILQKGCKRNHIHMPFGSWDFPPFRFRCLFLFVFVLVLVLIKVLHNYRIKSLLFSHARPEYHKIWTKALENEERSVFLASFCPRVVSLNEASLDCLSLFCQCCAHSCTTPQSLLLFHLNTNLLIAPCFNIYVLAARRCWRGYREDAGTCSKCCAMWGRLNCHCLRCDNSCGFGWDALPVGLTLGLVFLCVHVSCVSMCLHIPCTRSHIYALPHIRECFTHAHTCVFDDHRACPFSLGFDGVVFYCQGRGGKRRRI